MRGRIAPIAAATTVLIFIFVLFVSAPSSWTEERSKQPKQSELVLGYVPYAGRPNPLPWNPPRTKAASPGNTAKRLVVKVKLEDEDTAWIQKLESTWQNDIITIDSMYSLAHPDAHRPDKGRVANVYLVWIVENYNNMPETLVFLPPADMYKRETLNHHDALTRLQTPYIQQSGFANLRCPFQKSKTSCNDKVFKPHEPPHEFRTLEASIPKVWEQLFGNKTDVPQQIATVLGADFAVSKAQVHKRSVEEYLRYWTWLNRTIMDDDSAGLLFEYIWHIVFGKEASFCPDPARCQCDLYGGCENV
jgi:hypothetical protein